LLVDLVQASPTDDLVFEIATDRAGFGEASTVCSQAGIVGRVATFEIHSDRKIDRFGNPRCIGKRKVQRNFLTIAKTIRH
jgi:hypothetical protein